MGARKSAHASTWNKVFCWFGFKVLLLGFLAGCFHRSACVLAYDHRGPLGPLWKYNATTGWSKTSASRPKATSHRTISLRHIDQSKSGPNGTSYSTNVSAFTVDPQSLLGRLHFGPSAMAYISPHALWLIDGNGRLHARFWEAMQDRWVWEEGPLIPPIKSIELTGHSRWLCSGADQKSLYEMSLQLPPWQKQVGQNPALPQPQPTAKWTQVPFPEATTGAMYTSGLTFGFSTFFVSESLELWELLRSTTTTPPLHSWRNHEKPPGAAALSTVVALHSVDLPSSMLQQQSKPTQMLQQQQPGLNGWELNPWTQQTIDLLIFCICVHDSGPELWSYSVNASFTTGWLQARVHQRKGHWTSHGAPEGTALTTMPAARIGGVFGESSKGGVFFTSANGSLVERHWNGASWNWRVFGSPKKGVSILSAPGACINDRSMFVVGSDRHVWEFYREGAAEDGEPRWVWVAHGAPNTAKKLHLVMPTRGTAMNNKCLFFRVAGGALVERRWTGDRWKWYYHGLPEKMAVMAVEEQP